MALSEHVTLTISQDSVGVARAGFGVPMILSVNAAFAERIRFYTDLAGVLADFTDTKSPEYLAAAAIFSQNPHPSRIAIGRAVGKPTMRYKITVSTVEHSHTYKLLVRGPNLTTTTVTYAADSATDDGEIVAGLVAALDAVTANDGVTGQSVYTPTGSSSPLAVTGDVAGNWFSIESLEPGYLKIEMDHAEPATTLATDLTAIQAENDDWYGLVTLYNSDAYIKAAAAWVETQKKIYVADLSASETVTLASGGGDTADDLEGLTYARTFVAYHPSPADMMGAAWMGACLWIEPGGETWKFKRLTGVTPVVATATHRTNIRAKSANTYTTVAGVNITWEGTTCDGDFVDATRGLDWLEDDMTKAIFGTLAGAKKIPMDEGGVSTVKCDILASLDRAVARGILASNPAPTVVVPIVSAISTNDKAIRYASGFKFNGTLAGAIHKVGVTGVVSV